LQIENMKFKDENKLSNAKVCQVLRGGPQTC
jgi:hypothetical protein